MECFLCEDERKCTPWDFDDIAEHLIVTQNKDGKFHIHGPIKNEEKIKKIVNFILKEAKIDSYIHDSNYDKNFSIMGVEDGL